MTYKTPLHISADSPQLLDWIRLVDLQKPKLVTSSVAETLNRNAPLLRIPIRFYRPKKKHIEVLVTKLVSQP